MKIGFNPGSIVDLNGSPLVGRVTVYEHDSDIVKDVYTLDNALCVLSGNIYATSALASDSDIKCLVAFISELLKSNVFSDLNSKADIYAKVS